jgi:hypothetical protein
MQSTRLASQRSCALPLLTLALAGPATAQWWQPTRFSAPVLISGPSSDGVVLTRAVDLDGDGDEDLVVASHDDERLVWHEALTGGGFGPARVIAAGARVASLTAGDIEGDGDVDLVVTSTSSPIGGSVSQTGVLWFEGLGGGQFRAAGYLIVDVPERNQGTAFAAPTIAGTAIAFGPLALEVGDLDGDGLDDLVVASYESVLQYGSLAWYRNLGGSFTAAQVFGNQPPGSALAIADTDGDGDLDVLSARGDGLAIYENNGLGGFGTTQLIPSGAGAWRVQACDFDGDNDVDVAFSMLFGGVNVVPRTGPASFGPALSLATSSPAFTFADFDSDGDLDLAGGGEQRTAVYWRAGLGGGSFAPAQDLGGPELDTPSDVALVDLDLDGDLDTLVCDQQEGKVVWFENVGGTFGPAQLVGVVPQPSRVAAGDLDGDGDVDVLVAGTNATWFPRQGAGFGAGALLLGTANDTEPADLDGDGDLDVVIASNDALRWRVNQGGGNFGLPLVIAASFQSAPADVHVADLDGNGFLDVIAVGNTIEDIVVVPNLGGTFGPKQVLDIPFSQSPVRRVGAGDIDGDGRIDVLAGGESFFWFRNLGAHTYDPWQWAGFFGGFGAGFAPADIDGDGDLDFVHTYDNNDELVLWRENHGGGNLVTEHLVTDEAEGPLGVAVGDVDGDGDPDVVSVSFDDHSVLLHTNTVARVTPYCAQPVPNSSGAPGRLRVEGSLVASENRLVLSAYDLPINATGYFLTSRAQGNTPMPGGSRGTLCLGGAIGRFTGPGQVRNSGSHRQFTLALDLTMHPTPNGALGVLANETWFFQAWHRDTFQGAPTSNFTDAIGLWFE